MHEKLLGAIETVYDCVGNDFDRARALEVYSKIADDSAVIMADMNLLLGRATRVDHFNIEADVSKIFSTRFKCPMRNKLIKVLRNHPPCVPVLRESVVSGEA